MPTIAGEDHSFSEQIATAARLVAWPAAEISPIRGWWHHVWHPAATLATQGWKLHLSATVVNDERILARALPILLREPLTFKVAATRGRLARLNAGDAGRSQIGKFITIYPRDDEQAVRLATALDAATRGLDGPTVPSDRALHPGSRVSYRYGEFRRRAGYDPLGQPVSFLEGPDGRRQPDRRGRFAPPDWAPDPFVAAGVAAPDAPTTRLVGGRYLLCQAIHVSARGSVHEAIDVRAARPCIVKQARRGAAVSADGQGAIDELRNEAAILRRLDGVGGAPLLHDLLDDGETVTLAMEEITGENLDLLIGREAARHAVPDPQTAARIGAAIAELVAALHAHGILHRDLKPGNILLDEAGNPRLIDFGSAHDPATAAPSRGFGTRGYLSPQQRRRDSPTAADDIYALGAILYALATGADPSNAPDPTDLLSRPPARLNPAIGPALAAIIARCLQPDPALRYISATELATTLRALGAGASVPTPPRGAVPVGRASDELATDCLALVDRLIAALAAHARPHESGDGNSWPEQVGEDDAPPNRWLYDGDAGIVYALAELAPHRPAALPLLRCGVAGILAAPETESATPDGLYVGLAGVGVALLRAGQVLDTPDLTARAVALGREVARMPRANPDLLHGVAGRLRYQLILFDATGDPTHLTAARADGDWLCATADRREGAICWRIPEPWGDYLALGYAHGAAGIADALLELWETTGEDRYREVAGAVADRLAREAYPALTDGSGLNWRNVDGKEDNLAAWCHGAGGIGQFFLHAHVAGLYPGALTIACRAGWTLARGARADGPIQCHGLAGHIEYLLDLAEVTGDPAWLAEARSLGELTLGHAIEREDLVVLPGRIATQIRPGLLTGYAGAALALLRLADPESQAAPLSRAAFVRAPRAMAVGGR